MRSLIAAVAIAALVLTGSGAARAQEGGLFTGLGLPEVTVTLTADGLQAPAEIPAGRILVTVDNQTDIGDPGLLLSFAKVPEGVSLDQINTDLASDEAPSYFWDMVFAGGVAAMPHGTGQGVVELDPGVWTVANSDQLGVKAIQVTVTGEPAADPQSPKSAVSLKLMSYGFDFPATLPAGPQVWEITNTSPVPHHIVLFKADKRYTYDEMQLALEQEMSGTPVAGAPATDAISDYSGVDLLSPGHTVWAELDLEPGEYVAMCFMADKLDGSVPFHAMLGMVGFFTVSA